MPDRRMPLHFARKAQSLPLSLHRCLHHGLCLTLAALSCVFPLQAADAGAIDAIDASTPATGSPPRAPMRLRWDAQRAQGVVALPGHLLLWRQSTAGAASAQRVADLPVQGSSELSLSAADGLAYVSVAAEGLLREIDIAQALPLHQVPAAASAPGKLLFHPVFRKLLSFNRGTGNPGTGNPGTGNPGAGNPATGNPATGNWSAGNVTLFDAASRAYEGQLPLGDVAAAVALAPDARVLILLPERRDLTLIGVRPFRIFARFPLPADCADPRDLAVDAPSQRVYLACSDRLVTFDYEDGDWEKSPFQDGQSSPIAQLFWDAPRARLLVLHADGAVTGIPREHPVARLLTRLPAGSVADWDALHARLVSALATEDPVLLTLHFTQVP